MLDQLLLFLFCCLFGLLLVLELLHTQLDLILDQLSEAWIDFELVDHLINDPLSCILEDVKVKHGMLFCLLIRVPDRDGNLISRALLPPRAHNLLLRIVVVTRRRIIWTAVMVVGRARPRVIAITALHGLQMASLTTTKPRLLLLAILGLGCRDLLLYHLNRTVGLLRVGLR